MYRWKLTRKQYTFMDLLSKVDSKLFAKCKSKGHCLHHMLPSSHPSSHVMVLRPLVMTMMSLESLMRLQSGRS